MCYGYQSQYSAVVQAGKPWGTHYRLKAYPIDPRQQMQFPTDLTIRGKAALVALGAAFATAPAIAEMAG
jgi:small conductance mechanosensitive channel